MYLANGYAFPDALSAAPAAAHFGSPVLLTAPDSLPGPVAGELARLAPQQIVVVGGLSAVSDPVLAAVRAAVPGATVRRVAGPDRYETSRLVATDAFGTSAATAYLATGADYPDALAAAPAAAHFGGPILLVPGAAGILDPATTALLTSLHTTTIRLAGGPVVLSAGIEAAAGLVPGVTAVHRQSGGDRYATAAAINLDAFATSAISYLAAGTGFPDALVGAALAGWKNAPLYLSPQNCVEAGAFAGIQRLGSTTVVLFGGTAVLGDAVSTLSRC